MPKTSGRPVKKGKNRAKAIKSRPQLTAQQLYQQAQIALQYDDAESARDALRQAVQLEPTNLEFLEAYGSLLAEMGDEEQARVMLHKAVELSPDVGHEKYMYLGQLLEGEEALRMTRQGIALLQALLDCAVSSAASGSEQQQGGARAGRGKAGSSQALDEDMDAELHADDADGEEEDESLGVPDLQAQLCSALCSLAELLMGQAETVEAVGPEAEALLTRARTTCSLSPEPGQALASLRYEQGRPEEALEELRSSMKLWFKPRGDGDSEAEAMDKEGERDGEAGDSGDELGPAAGQQQQLDGDSAMDHDEEDTEALQPTYEFRFECAKLLLELDDSTEAAIQVLEDMVEEEDSNPHTWHLLGMAYYGGHMFEEAQEIYDKGMKLLKKLKVPEDDELYADYADLQGAIEDASRTATEC